MIRAAGCCCAINLTGRLFEIAPDGRVVRSMRVPRDFRPVMAVDPAGRVVYAVNPSSGLEGGTVCYLARWERDGSTTILAGHPNQAPGLQLPTPPYVDRSPYGVALGPGGELFYTGGDWRVHRIAADGTDSVLAGTGHQCAPLQLCMDTCPPVSPETCSRDGALAEAEFDGPAAIACDADGRLYVMDGPRSSRNATLRAIE